MRYMYTTQPDEGCHEVESGIYGRPVRTDQQGTMRKQGWSYSIDAQRGKNHVREEKEGREEEREVGENMDYDEYLRREHERVFGKKPHHKMKRETIEERLKEHGRQ